MSRFKLNTIGLFTTDNQKMVDFYCDIFGFETKWNGLDIDVEMHLSPSTSLGQALRILLFPRESIEKMTQQRFTYPSGINGTMEISFDVATFADVDKEYDRAVRMGAKPIMEPTTEPWGQRTCYVADPEGIKGHFWSHSSQKTIICPRYLDTTVFLPIFATKQQQIYYQYERNEVLSELRNATHRGSPRHQCRW